ncbi:MAG: hypothetical protein RR922_06290 [Clostridia bacterium]
MNDLVNKISVDVLKNKSILAIFIFVLCIFTFNHTGNNYYINSVYWSIYSNTGNVYLINFALFPFFFLVCGKMYFLVFKNKEILIRLKDKKNVIRVIHKAMYKVTLILYAIICIVIICSGIIFSNGNFESVLIPGILVPDYIMMFVNMIKIFAMLIIIQKFELYLLSKFADKKVALLMLLFIDFLMCITIYLDIPSGIEKMLPASLMYDNHLYKNLLECVIYAFCFYGITNVFLTKINRKIILKSSFNFKEK